MAIQEVIIEVLKEIASIDLNAPTRGERRKQLADYRTAFNLIVDAAGPVPPTHELFNAKAKAVARLTELEKYFDSYECVRMATEVLMQAKEGYRV